MHRPPGTHPPPRPPQKIDWELVACGFTGHELVALSAPPAAPDAA